MNIKNYFLATFLAFLTFAGFTAFAETDPDNDGTPKKMTEKEFKVALEALTERIDVLKEARKNAGTKEEKRAVKDEIAKVKKEAKELKSQANGYGIYISTGALLVIILLILLL